MKFSKIPCLLLAICALACFQHVDSYKILGIAPTMGRSHSILIHSLLIALAEKGHDVTILTTFPSNKNQTLYKEIPIKANLRKIFFGHDKELNAFAQNEEYGLSSVTDFFVKNVQVAEAVLNDTSLQEILKKKEKWDAVMIVSFMNEALFAIAHELNANLIVFSTMGPSLFTDGLVGNPAPYSYVPNALLNIPPRMTFGERVKNALVSTLMDVVKSYVILPMQETARAKFFPNSPDLYEVIKNTSLVLLSSHVSISNPRPLVPNTIEIGGFHIKDPKPLPADLKKFLDDAKEGVVYFSLGSNVQSKHMPVEMKNAIVASLAKLKQKVLWKWEEDVLPGQPKNVKTMKWAPQNDLLAHPNVKLFITHGGWGSINEAIDRKVPLVGIPVLADQAKNMQDVVTHGYGVQLELTNITEKSFSWAINEVLNNAKYAENVKEISRRFHDREMKPMDRAIFWVEYVIRNKGAMHLQSPAVHLSTIELLNLDVIAFLGAIAFGVFAVFMLMCYCCYRGCKKVCGSSSKPKTTKKAKKDN